MRYAREVHACMNFLRIDKKAKSYRMLLAETLSMVASGETLEKSPQQCRDTHHTLQSQLLVLETTLKKNKKKKTVCAYSAHFYKVHRQLTPAWPVSREHLMLPSLTSSCYLDFHLRPS